MAFAAGLLGGVMQMGAAKKASKDQANTAQQDLAFQKETRDLTRADLAPFKNAGSNALAAYNYLLGLGSAPTIGGTAASIETINGVQPGVQPGQLVGVATAQTPTNRQPRRKQLLRNTASTANCSAPWPMHRPTPTLTRRAARHMRGWKPRPVINSSLIKAWPG